MNYTNFYKNILLIATVTLSLYGCQGKLNQIPQTSITDANFWKTPNDLKLACNYLYSYLPGLGFGDPTGWPAPYWARYSEIGYSLDGANAVSDGSRLAPASSGEWNGYYELIRASNNIIQHAHNVTGEEQLKEQYIGEAKFFRAYAYYNLVKRYGAVPYINKTLTLQDSLLYSSRVDKKVIVDSIYADLDYAATHCPSIADQSSEDYGRISATAALAFKSRVALFAGTWNKFHQTGDYKNHLQLCIDACETIMNSGNSSLFTYPSQPDSSYFYLFHYQNATSRTDWDYSNNREIILPRLYGASLDNNISSHTFERGGATDGGVFATRKMINYYLYKDGLPVGKSPYDSSAKETSTLTQFRNRDPRMGMTFFNKHDTYPSITGFHPYQPGNKYNLKKYNNITDFAQSTSFQDFWIIRYAEVLLNYAEATYELNDAISDQELNKSINLLRKRVDMPALTNAFVDMNGLSMRAEIRRERTVELCFEGFHYWDVLRWKTAEELLPNALIGPKYFPDEMAIADPDLNSDGFIILQAASKRSFDPNKDYLWPLPTQQLALTPKLTQNPGW